MTASITTAPSRIRLFRHGRRPAQRVSLRQAKALAAAETTAAKAAPEAAVSNVAVGSGPPSAQPAGHEYGDERGHLHDGLDRAEHAEDAAEQRGGRAGVARYAPDRAWHG